MGAGLNLFQIRSTEVWFEVTLLVPWQAWQGHYFFFILDFNNSCTISAVAWAVLMSGYSWDLLRHWSRFFLHLRLIWVGPREVSRTFLKEFTSVWKYPRLLTPVSEILNHYLLLPLNTIIEPLMDGPTTSIPHSHNLLLSQGCLLPLAQEKGEKPKIFFSQTSPHPPFSTVSSRIEWLSNGSPEFLDKCPYPPALIGLRYRDLLLYWWYNLQFIFL